MLKKGSDSEHEPSFGNVMDALAMVHKQNMEMLDKIIELKRIQSNEVKDEVFNSSTTD